MVRWRTWLSETGMHENPLVPNAKLRQMYVAMAEARVLDEHVVGSQKRVKSLKAAKGRGRLNSIRGQEACRVSTAMDLGPGDLVSDSQAGVVMDLLAGAKVSSLLNGLDGVANLSAKTARWGVPGIPVDAGDAVALYRVAQESLGRTRGGDGPVLIECVAYRMEGSGGGTPGDPLVQMKEFLVGRKVCTKA